MTKIAVIGSGIVGTATGKGFAAKGHTVVFTDINPAALERLSGEGFATCAPAELSQQDADIFVLTISTPTKEGHITLDYLLSAVTDLAQGALKAKQGYCTVVVRSTVPPGTTEEKILPLLEQHSGKKVDKDFGLAMNPEYLRENRNEQDFQHPWIVIAGGHDAKALAAVEAVYQPLECPFVGVKIKEAEMEKYLHNIFNAHKISFFNEMRAVCKKVGVDADTVFRLVVQSAEASWNHAYGTRDMGPFDGSCLPKDTQAFLYWASHELQMQLPVLQADIEANNALKNAQK